MEVKISSHKGQKSSIKLDFKTKSYVL